MIIKKLTLRNFCQHENRVFEFAPGLNMLMGSNGAGKTNVLRALRFALTGSTGTDRNKADDIRQGSGKEESYVEAELLHEGATMIVRRGLRGSSNLLQIGDSSWTAAKEIDSELLTRLDVTKSQLTDYVIVRQRAIDEIFDQRPADRAASLANLFGASKAANIYQELRNLLSTISVPTTTLQEDELVAAIQEANDVLATVAGKQKQLNVPANIAEYTAKQSETLAVHAAFSQLVSRAGEAKLNLERRDLVAKKLEQQYTELQETVNVSTEMIAETQAAYDEAKEAIWQWQQYDETRVNRESLTLKRDTLIAKMSKIVEPEPPAVEEPDDTERTRAAELAVQIQNYVRDLRALSGDTNCPTCGQRLPDADAMETQRQKLNSALNDARETHELLDTKIQVWDTYSRLLDRHTRQIEESNAELARIGDRLKDLRAFESPAMPKDQATAAIACHEANIAAHKTLEQQLLSVDRELRSAQGIASQAQTQYDTLLDEMGAITPPTDEEAAEASKERTRMLTLQKEVAELQQQHSTAQVQLNTATRQLQELEKVRKDSAMVLAAVEHFKEVQSIFHRDAAPRMVSYTYMEAMLDAINETLDMFEAPFRVEADDNLAFVARFLNGSRVVPDSWLSVGERIVLAMAFRITVNATFAGQVGMLVMDEPTAGLDEHNLENLPKALERLRELSHARGLQVLFVTHEPRISHLFDNTIDLSAR